MKRRWIKRSGLALLLVLLGATITWSIWYAQCKAELDAEVARIRARGEPLEFADLAPREHDYARERKLRAALSSIPQLPPEFFDTLEGTPFSSMEGVPLFGEDTPALENQGIQPGDYPVLRRAVAENRKVVDRVVRLAREGNCCFTHDYASSCPIAILLPHVDALCRVRDVMKAEVIQALGTGKPHRAFHVIDDMLHVAEVLRHEPFVISQLVRSAVHKQVSGLLELSLSHEAIEEEQLMQLDHTLERIEAASSLRSALVAERSAYYTIIDTVGTEEFVQMMSVFPGLRPGVRGVQGWIDDWRDAARPRWWGSTLYRPWLFQEKVFLLQTMTRAADLVDQPGPDADRQWEALWDGLGEQLKDYPIYSAIFPGGYVLRRAAFERRQRLVSARLALRVERFRRENRSLPATLEDVLDVRLTAVPKGLISGKPLNYEVTAEGFRIYDQDPKSSEAVGKFEILRAKPH